MIDPRVFQRFVMRVAPRLNLAAELEPGRTLPRLLVDGKPTQLIYQNVPFFFSAGMYWIPPEFAVMYEAAFVERAAERNWPVYIWIDFPKQRIHNDIVVPSMRAVWESSAHELYEKAGTLVAPLHEHGFGKRKTLHYVLDMRYVGKNLVANPPLKADGYGTPRQPPPPEPVCYFCGHGLSYINKTGACGQTVCVKLRQELEDTPVDLEIIEGPWTEQMAKHWEVNLVGGDGDDAA